MNINFGDALKSIGIGALVTFGLNMYRDHLRNKPRMDVRVIKGMIYYYKTVLRLPSRTQQDRNVKTVFVYCEPTDEGAIMRVILDVLAQNRSWLDDAFTSAVLNLNQNDNNGPFLFAKTKKEEKFEEFMGENVKSHSLKHFRLYFELSKEDFEAIPSITDHSFSLKINTIRGKTIMLPVPVMAFLLLAVTPEQSVTD